QQEHHVLADKARHRPPPPVGRRYLPPAIRVKRRARRALAGGCLGLNIRSAFPILADQEKAPGSDRAAEALSRPEITFALAKGAVLHDQRRRPPPSPADPRVGAPHPEPQRDRLRAPPGRSAGEAPGHDEAPRPAGLPL